MTSYAFYLSEHSGPDRQPITLPGGGHAYIRVERLENTNCIDALDAARCMPDESLMNTYELPFPECDGRWVFDATSRQMRWQSERDGSCQE